MKVGRRGIGTRWSIRLCLLLFALAASSALGLVDKPELRKVRLILTLNTADGEPVSEVGYAVESSVGRAWADTNDQGVALIELDIPVNERQLQVSHEDGTTAGWTPAERARRERRLLELFVRYYYPYGDERRRELSVKLVPERSEYRLTLEMEPAIEVSGILVTATGERPISSGVVKALWSNDGSANPAPGGRFVLQGVPRSKDNELFVNTFPLVTPVFISAAQTSENLNLGPLRIRELGEEPAGALDLSVKAKGRIEDLNGRKRDCSGVVLIRDDGRTILSFFLNSEKKIHIPGQPFPSRIPAGTYYVLPGPFSATNLEVGLRDAIASGIDLSQSGIPKVTVVENEITTFEFDANASAEAVRRLLIANS